MRVEQEIRRHHDGGEHIVEIVRDTAGQLSDRLHFLLLLNAVFERALRGRFERVNDRSFAVAVLFLDRQHEEVRPAFCAAGERRFDRCNIALPLGGLADRRFEHRPVAPDDHRQDRAVVAFEQTFKCAGKARIAACDPAGLVDSGDGHRRVLEEAHETHFGSALRIAAVAPRPIEHERARGAGRAVGAEGDFVEQAHRDRLAAAGFEIEVKNFRLYFAGCRVERREQRRAFARDDIPQLERAGARPAQDHGRATMRESHSDRRCRLQHRQRKTLRARGRDSRRRIAAPGIRFPAVHDRA